MVNSDIKISIQSITSIKQVHFGRVDKQVLVIVDLIGTLINPSNAGQLIEPEFETTIKTLKGTGCCIIIMSHLHISDVASMQECYQSLQEVGIDLSTSFAIDNLTLKMFDDLLVRRPIYYKGIIFTNGYPKAEVLRDFLEEVEFVPSEIFFIDDHMEYVKSMAVLCKHKKISFHGYYYQGSNS